MDAATPTSPGRAVRSLKVPRRRPTVVEPVLLGEEDERIILQWVEELSRENAAGSLR